MALEIGKTVDGYEVVEVLGSSKTGVAYKVRNVFAQRFEVLKILPKSVQDDEEQNARFLREIKVHAQLLHPNIVTFYNARQMAGQLVMTTEFVPGVTLAERLEAGPIAWRDACHFADQVLSALACAHEHGIVHRGLSSSNLMLTPEGSIRLTGFGLAKSIADPDLTTAGSVIGALKYMAPEQVKGEAIDGRSDLYSLGVVLYEMLTARLPFAAKGQFEIMLAHVNTAPEHASDVNAEVPRELGDVVAKSLAKSPDDRFSNAQEFRSAIDHICVNPETTPDTPVHLETAQPLVEAVPFPDTPAPVSSSESWDAWSFDPHADQKPSRDPDQTHRVAGLLHTPASEPALASVESTPVVQFAGFSETPTPGSTNVLWDAHAIEAALLSAQSEPPPSEPEPPSAELTPAESPAPSAPEMAEPPVENAAATEILAPASSHFLWDAWAINPAPVESHSAPVEWHPEEPPVDAVALTETPAPVSSPTLWDAWAVESALSSAESHLTPPEWTPGSSALETVTPPAALPATLHDPWANESKATSVESAPVEAELRTPLPLMTALADTPVAVRSPLYDAWAPEATPAQPEPNPEPCELKLLSAALETPAQAEPSANALTVDWPTRSADLWSHEPAHSAPESPREYAEWELVSAAQEPPKLHAEQVPPPLPSAPEEPLGFASTPPAVELAAPTPEPEPATAVAALASVPEPVVQAVRPPNPDLLTALFGDSLLSRMSLALVICAIVFLLGTVVLFAVFSVSKP
jgi:serine/threonine protein kinase